MFKLARFIAIFVGAFFAYHCVNCLLDADRFAEHSAASYGLFCSALLIAWGALASDIVE